MTQSRGQILDDVMGYLMDSDSCESMTIHDLVCRFPDIGEDDEVLGEAEALLASHRFFGATGESTGSMSLLDRDIREVGQHFIVGFLGRGGFAEVYKALHRPSGEFVAMKLLRFGQRSNSAFERFKAESELMRKINHPGVVKIFETGEYQGQPFFTMEWVEGSTLSQFGGENTFPHDRLVGVLRGIATALLSAHQNSILHRDLKPDNVLLTRSLQPRLCDFGLARKLDEEGNATQSSALLGTINYLAPEIAGNANAASERSDIYGFGAILYFLLTGGAPFRGCSPAETLAKLQTEELITPRDVNPQADPQLEAVCLKCMRRDPARRYQDVSELIGELDRIERGRSVQAPVNHPGRRLVRWIGRHRVATLLTAVIFVSVAALTMYEFARRQQAAERQIDELKRDRLAERLQESQLERQAQSARTKMIAAQWDDAIRIYDGVIQQNPPGKSFHILQRAKCLIALRRFADARSSLEALLTDGSDALVFNTAQLWFAEAIYREDMDQARRILLSIDGSQLESADRRYLTGMLAKDSATAADSFADALKLNPVHFAAARRLAGVLALRGQFHETLSILDVCQRLFPDDPEYRFGEAVTWSLMGESETSEQVFLSCEEEFGETMATRYRNFAKLMTRIRSARPGALKAMSFVDRMALVFGLWGDIMKILTNESDGGIDLPPIITGELQARLNSVSSWTGMAGLFHDSERIVQLVRDLSQVVPDGYLYFALAMDARRRGDRSEAVAALKQAVSEPSFFDVKSRSLYLLCRFIYDEHHTPSFGTERRPDLTAYLQQFADDRNPDLFSYEELNSIVSIAWSYEEYEVAEKVIYLWKKQHGSAPIHLALGINEMHQENFESALVRFLGAKRNGSSDGVLDENIQLCCDELQLDSSFFLDPPPLSDSDP